MRLFDRRDKGERLLDLLDRERAALLRGDFAALHRIVAEKERLLALVAREQPKGHWLNALRSKVARNHALLEAARQGIQSVRKDLQAAAGDFGTYDKAGLRSAAISVGPALERRV